MERMEDDKQRVQISDFCNFLRIFASNNQSIANGRIAAVFATMKWLNMQAIFTLVLFMFMRYHCTGSITPHQQYCTPLVDEFRDLGF